MELFIHYGGYLITPLHILVCLILIAVVLLQTGKGADIAGAFGGAGTQSAFGPRGVENYLSRMTKWAAFTFMFTSLALSIVKWGGTRDDFNELPSQEEIQGTASPSPTTTTSPVSESGGSTSTGGNPNNASSTTETIPGPGSMLESTPTTAPVGEPAATGGDPTPTPP